MKKVIFYKSVLGSTKKYAQWLGEKIEAPLYQFSEAGSELIDENDLIVVASGTYAAKMPLVNFLKDNWPQLKNKQVFVLAVGMAPADDPQSNKAYQQIPEEIRQKIKYFKAPGKIFMINSWGDVEPKHLNPLIKEVKQLGK